MQNSSFDSDHASFHSHFRLYFLVLEILNWEKFLMLETLRTGIVVIRMWSEVILL